ncbi:hypothetical protein EDB85DRAFT_2048788 [Lactarius pseudohatsudake]|nr:hypothetical protein EDB85DRAFT_2048788 [Lactarius pseudohatsudake]
MSDDDERYDARPGGQQRYLAKDIFGSDSELSDAPDAEEENLPPRSRPTSAPPEAGEESTDDSADEYRQARAIPQKRRRPRRRERGDDEGQVARVGKTQRKRKVKVKKGPTEEDLLNLPPEEAKKLRLDMEIDTILKSNKASRPKKRKKEDDLDQFADAEISQLREEMLNAADLDDQANRDKHPAMVKLKLLPKVMGALRKSSLWQSIVDNNLLEGVRRWLEPLPDKSLPALNIQKDFFRILPSLDIDTAVLKESKLGRIVLGWTPDIVRIADSLVSAWSRPIIKRSASYRDRAIPTADVSTGDGGAPHERLNVILARAREGERNRVRKNAVMIPQRELGSYTVAPRSNSGVLKNNISVDMDIERRKRNADRLRSLTRKMGSQKV